MKCGLLGRKLGHSYSPQIHAFLSDYEYKLYEVEPIELESFMKNCNLDAFNVTIPYKKDVIPFCKKLSDGAKKIGAVNTIVKQKDGSYVGYNTDYYGFLYMINQTKVEIKGKKAIVLGNGGASLTCQCVLKDLGAGEVIVFDTHGENNYDNLHKHYDAQVIVNATPVGMFPNVDESLVDLTCFNSCEVVLDLIYNPEKTKLLLQAEQLGIAYENGLVMLIAQAKKACELFTDSYIDNSIIDKISKELKV